MAPAPVGREVGRAVPDLETPFFVSYAHTGIDSNQKALQFFNDLCADVATMVDLPAGADMGFIDAVGLRGGMRWRPELMRALGSCQVLIALLSVPYLGSEECGKEWHAFSQREKDPLPGMKASPHQGCIIPVRWAPIAIELPPVVKKEMIFVPQPTRREPDLPALYEQEGLFRLLQAGEEDSCGEIVWQIAKLIQKIYYSQRLRPREFEPDALTDVFYGSVP
jgi:hypothetical protein